MMDAACGAFRSVNAAPPQHDEASVPQPHCHAGCLRSQAGGFEAVRSGQRAVLSVELDERIARFLALTSKLVAVDDCLLVLVDQGDTQPMRLVAHANALSPATEGCDACMQVNQAAARKAIRTGKPLLHGPAHPFQEAMPRRPTCAVPSIAVSPIRIGERIVGTVNLNRAAPHASCGPADLDAVGAIAQLLGQTFHLNRLERILNSQFAQLAIARQASEHGSDMVLKAGADPERLARLLAKSFYGEMTKLGLDLSQIIVAASEIISQLSGTLKRHRDRRGRNRPDESAGIDDEIDNAWTPGSHASSSPSSRAASSSSAEPSPSVN